MSGHYAGGRLPILTYHHLSPERSAVTISPTSFRRQLARLRNAGFVGVPLGEALDSPPRIAAGRRPVALTFDDGYGSVLEYALPALVALGWRATVFPVGNFVGRTNNWPGQPVAVPRAPLLTWRDLQTLAGAGWEVGAHSRSHPDLTTLDDAALAAELSGGKALLEDGLGLAVRRLAFPYGRADRRVRLMARRWYAAACGTRLAAADPHGDRFALARLDAWYFAAPFDRLLVPPFVAPYAAARRAGRQCGAAWRTWRGLASEKGHAA